MNSIWLITWMDMFFAAISLKEAHDYIKNGFSDEWTISEKNIHYDNNGEKIRETIYLKRRDNNSTMSTRCITIDKVDFI